MTTYERAAQIWSVLALASWNRQVLTYDIVGRLIGVPRQGLGQLLEPIQSYCLVRGLPPLTILVVSEASGLPSQGFTATDDIPGQQVRVFGFDWLAETPPTPEVLEQAVKQQPSNGVQMTRPSCAGPRNGAELLSFWQSAGLVGTRSDIADAPGHARALREQAEKRERP